MNTKTKMTRTDDARPCAKMTAGLVAYAIALGAYLYVSGVGGGGDEPFHVRNFIAAATPEEESVQTDETRDWATALYSVVARIAVTRQQQSEAQEAN